MMAADVDSKGQARAGTGRTRGWRHLAILAFAALGLMLWTLPSESSAAAWLCPECQDARIERPTMSMEPLHCDACGASYTADELSWIVGYLNHRTRDAEVSWVVLPEDCSIFAADGLEALDQGGAFWVPWVAVDWYIPRMRLLKLTSGKELATDYPKGPTCEVPPLFAFEFTDSLLIDGQEPRARTVETEADLAELFIVARTPEARQEARERFIEEVETGKHPRLPRTPAKVRRVQDVRVPVGVTATGKTVVKVTVGEVGQILRIKVIESSGNGKLDEASVRAAQSSSYQSGGEMGVPVPSSVLMEYRFDGSKGTVTHKPAEPGVWR